MSFVSSEGVMGLMEELLTSTIPRMCPHLHMSGAPFPRMSYTEAMEKVSFKKSVETISMKFDILMNSPRKSKLVLTYCS